MCWYGRDFDDDEDDEYDDNVNDEYDEYDDSNIRLAVVDHHHNYHLSIMIVTIHHLFIIYSSSIHHLFIIYPSGQQAAVQQVPHSRAVPLLQRRPGEGDLQDALQLDRK